MNRNLNLTPDLSAQRRPAGEPIITESGNVIHAGRLVGKTIRLKSRRWVHARPGGHYSGSTYPTQLDAALALVEEVQQE
ncbi:hypothetical protein QE370_000423 [Aeromicrobium sp. SORGH_AS981]|uniref:hypothetical protein n=1 Tax=Aeromicrobium sp. SORGH_AS_0981 TaxID=3041802 RepID=UPI002857969B|nr:hypothetical protein [Aeromicrobium sp. SORGH_AS_0981]MDR6117239.1 hypothetical protein [Aeromicrobium sp. SORGH_AS_0981]